MATIRLTDKARTVIRLAKEHRTTILDGAVGSGKTTIQLAIIIDEIARGPKGLKAGVGATTESLHTNVLVPMQAFLGEKRCKIGSGGSNVRQGSVLGQPVLFRGAPNALAAGRIKGADLQFAFVDEVTEISQEYWRQLGYRMRGGQRQRIVGTTNPGSPGHWLHKDLQRARTIVHHDGSVERRDADWRDEDGQPALDLLWARFTMEDNPFLPPSYVEDVKASNTGVFFQRNVLGLWVAADGVIYDRYDENLHVITDDRLPRYPDGRLNLDHWHLSIDYGGSNPFNAGLSGWHQQSGTFIRCREWRYDGRKEKKTLSDDEYCDRLEAWRANGFDGLLPPNSLPWQQMRVVVDPSANTFMAALRRRFPGIQVIPADNTVLDGIRDVNNLLASGRLLINKACKHTLDEIVAYVWDDKAQQRGIDQPLKTNDHAMDELRYACRVARIHWQHATAKPWPNRPETLAA